jgi:hypothetical protein
MSTLVQTPTTTDTSTIAKVAADRAEALRTQAAAVTSEALAPLRRALLIRAGELDLAADVLLDPVPARRLHAVA